MVFEYHHDIIPLLAESREWEKRRSWHGLELWEIPSSIFPGLGFKTRSREIQHKSAQTTYVPTKKVLFLNWREFGNDCSVLPLAKIAQHLELLAEWNDMEIFRTMMMLLRLITKYLRLPPIVLYSFNQYWWNLVFIASGWSQHNLAHVIYYSIWVVPAKARANVSWRDYIALRRFTVLVVQTNSISSNTLWGWCRVFRTQGYIWNTEVICNRFFVLGAKWDGRDGGEQRSWNSLHMWGSSVQR